MAEQVIIMTPDAANASDMYKLQNVSSGKHLEEFIQYQKNKADLDNEGTANLRNSAVHILNHCNPHNAVTNLPTTHLVVGYVQSGKTMSFTSLIELALDCRYKVIIILAGITNNLLTQTCKRLRNDLICNNSLNNGKFKLHQNPDTNKSKEIIRNLKLNDAIVVISVLKHYDRINKVAELFENEDIKELIKNETAIIIDDEADQASLNNFGRSNSNENGQNRMSSTYEAIVNLRNHLIANSYVQYTATPQANVLISAIDILSPHTHTILYPGKGYCGGKLFFGVGQEGKRFGEKLLKTIPENEVFHSKANPLTSMPKSLEDALMLHIWAVIIITKYYMVEDIAQLSMMVHTDAELKWNSTFHTWIEETISRWSNLLEKNAKNVPKYGLLKRFESHFKEAISLYAPDPNLTFEKLSKYLPDVLNDTHVYLVTGESTDDIDNLEWDAHCSNILVGAQMLNRGFTVEKLTTTYMPRYSTSVTNADTIEQRCRFFGYKEKYILSCRVFLPQSSILNYKNYIESEEELRHIMEKTISLKECGHKILSFPKLRPTRLSVLPKNIVRDSLDGMKEFTPYENYLSNNLQLVDDLIKKHEIDTIPFSKNYYNYSDYDNLRAHNCFRLSIDESLDFLDKFQFSKPSDIRKIADTKRYIIYLSEKEIISDIMFINIGCGRYKERTLDTTNFELKDSSLFTGPSQSTDKSNYKGDRAMYVDETITIQLHHLEFRQTGVKAASIGIYYPKNLSINYTSTD